MSKLLSGDMRSNLIAKVKLFLTKRVQDQEVVIFTDNADLWKTDKCPIPVVHLSEPLPPIPVNYKRDLYDIGEEILKYVRNFCSGLRTTFTVASVQLGDEDKPKIHLLFSATEVENLGLKYLKGVRYSSSTSSSATSSSSSTPTVEKPVLMERGVHHQCSTISGRSFPKIIFCIYWIHDEVASKADVRKQPPPLQRQDSQDTLDSIEDLPADDSTSDNQTDDTA